MGLDARLIFFALLFVCFCFDLLVQENQVMIILL